jgi:hypothetical protein
MVYRFYCIWENKRRDKTGTLEAFEHGKNIKGTLICIETDFVILAYDDDLTDRKVRLHPYYNQKRLSALMSEQNPQFRYTI